MRFEFLSFEVRLPRLPSLPKLRVEFAPLALAVLLAIVASVIALLHVWEGGWIPKELS